MLRPILTVLVALAAGATACADAAVDHTVLAPLVAPARTGDAVPVLINGRFARGEWEEAAAAAIEDRVRILVCRDRFFVYLGIRFLRDMHTGVDVYLAAAGETPRRLHVSAAIGEAAYAGGVWGDLRWGANSLWSANSVGLIVEDGKQKTVPLEGFELQISLSMFAGTSWRVYLHLKRPELTYPASASAADPAGWLEIKLADGR